MDNYTDTPEIDNQTAPLHSQAASEDDEPTSFTETTKTLFNKHKGKIFAIGAVVVLVVVGVVASSAWQGTEDSEVSAGLDDANSGREDEDRRKRTSPVGHEVRPTLVKLAAGRQASEERRAAYKAAKGEDLPPGTTYRSEHRRGDFGEDETPSETAA